VTSILTPFFLAATIGGVASERIPPGNHAGDSITSWFNPMSMLFAFAGVVSAAFIAAVFLVSDAQRYGAPRPRGLLSPPVGRRGRHTRSDDGCRAGPLRGRDARPLFDGVTQGWALFSPWGPSSASW